MSRTLALGCFVVAAASLVAGAADARGHARCCGRAHARAHVAQSDDRFDHVTRVHARVAVDQVEHFVPVRDSCTYERSVCIDECRMASAAVCERCNRDVAMCERAATH